MRCKSWRLHLETHCCWTLCQCQLLLSNGSDYHCIYINIEMSFTSLGHEHILWRRRVPWCKVYNSTCLRIREEQSIKSMTRHFPKVAKTSLPSASVIIDQNQSPLSMTPPSKFLTHFTILRPGILHLVSVNFLSEKFQVQETLPFHLVQPFYLLTLPKSSHLPCPSLACSRFLNSNSNTALLFISVHVQRCFLCMTENPGCARPKRDKFKIAPTPLPLQ